MFRFEEAISWVQHGGHNATASFPIPWQSHHIGTRSGQILDWEIELAHRYDCIH